MSKAKKPRPPCQQCNQPTSMNTKGGWKKFCSDVCKKVGASDRAKVGGKAASAKFKDHESLAKRLEKTKATNQKKFGVDNAMQSTEVQERLKATNIIKHGVPYPLSLPETQAKIVATNQLRHGVDRPLQRKDIVVRAQASAWVTWEKNWPEGHPFSNEDVRAAGKATLMEKYGVENAGLINGFVSKGETELYEFVKTLCPDAVQTHRKIEGREVDIFIPSKNIAIEYNGIYWHQEQFKGQNGHADKLRVCNENGVRLVQIWEDTWKFKRNTVELFVTNLLGCTARKVNARNCIISTPSAEETSIFLNKHHMQGATGHATIRLGLRLKDELVAIMTFSKCPGNVKLYGDSTRVFQLTRYCSVGSIRGGFSRLLKYASLNNAMRRVYSFADLETVDILRNVYLTNDFKFHHILKPDYKYLTSAGRVHKFRFRQEELEGTIPSKIWDSGKVCFVYDISG